MIIQWNNGEIQRLEHAGEQSAEIEADEKLCKKGTKAKSPC